ncbi:MAG: alanine--tRNA ligase-related protein [Candidatus Paceibacterota bacterium]|jgi:alanyl-tRNA synthetase
MLYFQSVRKDFLNFFKSKGHAIVPSSSLIPDDPSVLLTTAGMQQFKRYYTGELNPESDFGSHRATSLQKCFRTSDIEEVGDDTHLTFFEMMGNFSFGPVGGDDPTDAGTSGYFKRSAIVWAWEFLTNVLELAPERLYVTVFEGDKDTPKDHEAYAVWKSEVGVPEDRIFWGNRNDNFWGPTGNQGPCGPTTEIYVAATIEDARKQNGVEVWNVVFNEYYARAGANGSFEYEKVKNSGIDTGMGFERLLATIEGVANVYETSAFEPIVVAIREAAPGVSERDIHILADHVRASSFLIADGIIPLNKEAGYVLRRLLRKIIAVRIKDDIHADIFQIGYEAVKKMFHDEYPTIGDAERILGVWREEQQKFEASITRGLHELQLIGETLVTGIIAFELYQTHGLPKELIMEFAKKTSPDFEKEFEAEEKKHQETSRAGAEKKFGGHGLVLDTGELKAGNEIELGRVIRLHTATHLLQWALRTVLGDEVHQMGSDINPERLRFDFNFDRKVTPEEIERITALANDVVRKDLPVSYEEMSKDDALASGALSFFKQKYPDKVKVYAIGSASSGGVVSAEFCGGPHVGHTGEIGTMRIIKEESVGKGVRRIRATVL